jgi:hypothetical protein
MDIDRAHAILGVDAATPLGDVRAADLARARLLHPDRLQGSDDRLSAEAGRAMADLNGAWEVVKAAGENRQPAASRASGPQDEMPLRLPVPGECDLCGSSPAHRIVLRRVTGLVLFWRSYRLEAEVCRVCATAMFREAQAHNMTAGWWGLIAPLANLYAIFSNLGQHSAVQHWKPPQARDPLVVTPLPGPVLDARRVSARPGPWFATIAAFAVLTFIIAGAVSDPSGGSPSRTSTDDVVGTCLDTDGYETPCSSSAAYWKITSRGPNCGSAPAVFTDPDTGRSYCAYRN